MAMNRMHRRMLRNLSELQPPRIPIPRAIQVRPTQDAEPDFSSVPLATLCESIWLLVGELRNRGYPVYDFDHKNKTVQGIKIIRDRVYFLAAEEADDGKAQARNKENGKQAY